ncbi:BTB/POZ domain-containing protein KCTD9-like [Pipra filicauda]|uniref:BTB/POZ domain-containing protein KCTD9-like n=1 Tax=Pipra filicauda TaxID=649802 RepID=A0A7R5KZQ5_9PASS|nr:BTB/POZ domain-containing protein KCTD9-like [Pipra filicauda]
MLRSSAGGASLKGCDSEDPSGLQANLEGASLKGVAMEGSQMTGITLRVAKSAGNLGDCWLLADLSSFSLQWSSGCDLQEANLRGSDVKGAIFEEMLTPLHMSQSVR